MRLPVVVHKSQVARAGVITYGAGQSAPGSLAGGGDIHRSDGKAAAGTLATASGKLKRAADGTRPGTGPLQALDPFRHWDSRVPGTPTIAGNRR
jgi:hypothetical protein